MVSWGLLMKNSTHVRPLTKLGLRLGESLDSYTKTILVPSSTLGCVLYLGGWRRDEVRILTADIKKTGALAVFGCQASKPIPDINKTSTVGDDGSIVALVVWHTLIPIFFRVVLTIV